MQLGNNKNNKKKKIRLSLIIKAVISPRTRMYQKDFTVR